MCKSRYRTISSHRKGWFVLVIRMIFFGTLLSAAVRLYNNGVVNTDITTPVFFKVSVF